MGHMRLAVCLTDPNLPDNPIIYINRAFADLTGYSADEVLGRNCRILQGPQTNPETIDTLRSQLSSGGNALVEIVNYRRDGTPFWNALHIAPITDDDGRSRYFFGSQWDVSELYDARRERDVARSFTQELAHRLRNLRAVAGSIVTLTTRQAGLMDVGSKINQRLGALGRAQDAALDDELPGLVPLSRVVADVLEPFDFQRGGTSEALSRAGTLALEGPDVMIEPGSASTLGLLLNELASNALKHGALGQGGGHVSVRWDLKPLAGAGGENGRSGQHSGTTNAAPREAMLLLDWRETLSKPLEGPALPRDGHGTGHSIVERLLLVSGGTFSTDLTPNGMHVHASLPIAVRKGDPPHAKPLEGRESHPPTPERPSRNHPAP